MSLHLVLLRVLLKFNKAIDFVYICFFSRFNIQHFTSFTSENYNSIYYNCHIVSEQKTIQPISKQATKSIDFINEMSTLVSSNSLHVTSAFHDDSSKFFK